MVDQHRNCGIDITDKLFATPFADYGAGRRRAVVLERRLIITFHDEIRLGKTFIHIRNIYSYPTVGPCPWQRLSRTAVKHVGTVFRMNKGRFRPDAY